LALARQERLDDLIPSTDRWWGRSQFATHAGKLEGAIVVGRVYRALLQVR